EGRRLGPAVLAREAHGLVDRNLGRDVVAVVHLVEGNPQHVALERRDALERPASGTLGGSGVELLAMGGDAVDELAREWPGTVEELAEHPPGHVGLVEGEDGVAALLG